MHNQLPSWQLIQNSLQQNIALMLLYVIESKGSSPGRKGFMMVVNAAGEMSGSLGGGIMEHKFVELAKSKLNEPGEELSIHQQLHDKISAKNQSGMICSGEQTIFLYKIKPQDKVTVKAIINAIQLNNNGCLQLTPRGIAYTNNIPAFDFKVEIKGDVDFTYQEKTGRRNLLYIIGGGHCALALSRLMSAMDFYIHLLDDRPSLNTVEQNNAVDKKRIVADYALLGSLVPEGNNSYVVIMSFGYRTDMVALEALMGKDFKYIGVLGSKNKIQKMFKDFNEKGITPQQLNHIHAPIGISIKSQTPEEIAVSIAAEIIRVKNEHL